MNAMTKPAIARAAAEMIERKIEVDDEAVLTALVRDLIDNRIDGLTSAMDHGEAIEAGIDAAIDDFDDLEFDAVIGEIRDRVNAEVEAQAKQIATRLLRECAAAVRAAQELEVE